MSARAEHFGTAAEIAGHPISERDLAASRRGVEYAHEPAFDEENAVVRLALAEYRLAATKQAGPPSGEDLGPRGGVETTQQVRLSPP